MPPIPDMSGYANDPQKWMKESGGTMQDYQNQMQLWQQSQQGGQPAQPAQEQGQWQGSYQGGGWDANYGAKKIDPSSLGSNPTPTQIRQFSWDQGWGTDDYGDISDAQIQQWVAAGKWDAQAGRWRNDYGDLVDKPTDDGSISAGRQAEYNVPGRYSSPNQVQTPGGGGGGGGGAGGGGGWNGQTSFGGAPVFTPPSYEEAMSDPGYQFALGQGMDALQGSQAARGVLRTGGSLQDLIDYGQAAGAQQYNNVFGRQMAAFQPNWNAWQTVYGGDLQKYLQKEQNIYGLLNSPPPWAYGAY